MRIVAAIGGSILLQDYNAERFKEYAKLLKEQSEEHEIFVVVGGGKPAREYIGVVRDLGAGEAKCDDIGIEVTRVNAKLLLLALGDAAYQRVPHNFQEALEFSASGKIIVMGGTEPAHSTDAVSAILAEYVQADLLVNLTAVDGLYTKDPKKYDDAVKYDTLTFTKVLNDQLNVMDMTAATMCRDNKLPILVFDMADGNIVKAIKGETIGTLVQE